MFLLFSRVLRDSTPRFVHRSVGPHFTFSAFLSVLSCLLLPNAPVTFSITAPAHPHATRVAVDPALF